MEELDVLKKSRAKGGARRSFIRPVPVHVLLVGFYPLLFLWNANFDQIPVFALSRVFFFSLALVVAAFVVSLLIFRNIHKAGIFTSFFLLLFYLYGHIFPLLDKKAVFGFVIGRHRYLLVIALALLVISGVVLLMRKPPKTLTLILNISSGALFGLALVSVATPYILNPGLVELERKAWTGAPKPAATAPADASGTEGRDVYYIVLDGYGREDLLREEHGLDISGFVQELEDLGFQVQDCAYSNYARTPFSLGSSLNMDYLDALGVQEPASEKKTQYGKLGDMLQHSQVRKQFEAMGYAFISFKGVYSWLNIQDADVYVDNDQAIPVLDRQETVNFQYLFLRTSALMYLFDRQAVTPEAFERLPTGYLELLFPDSSVFSTREYRQYKANLYALERLKEVPSIPRKKFVYAHLYITHQPYVFNADGSFRWPPLEDMNAYNEQIRFVNPKIIEIVKEIIAKSKITPVIVIQGDHSFLLNQQRMKILNAYYLPEDGDQALYAEITPVNTFRVIFNQYFGMNYPLLEDRSYYSEGSSPYQFEEIPIACPAGGE